MTNILSVCALLLIDDYHHSNLIYFKMQSSFLYVLMVARFCARQVNLLVLIIGSNDILDQDMIQKQAVSVAQFSFSEI